MRTAGAIAPVEHAAVEEWNPHRREIPAADQAALRSEACATNRVPRPLPRQKPVLHDSISATSRHDLQVPADAEEAAGRDPRSRTPVRPSAGWSAAGISRRWGFHSSTAACSTRRDCRRQSARRRLVNRAFASRYFPDGRAVGRRVVVQARDPVEAEIVGVVGDVRHQGIDVGSEAGGVLAARAGCRATYQSGGADGWRSVVRTPPQSGAPFTKSIRRKLSLRRGQPRTGCGQSAARPRLRRCW